MKEEKYNIQDSIKAQKQHCKKKDSPIFAPAHGKCYRCHKNIYKKHTKTRMFLGEEKETTTGITVEKAGNEVITGCPHCNYSFIS